MKLIHSKRLSLAVAIAGTMMAGIGQTADIDEIIVTATKSEKTLQEVPVAVSVVSAESIEAGNVIDLMDLKQLVPSFDTRQNQTSINSSVFIRGFGGGGSSVGIEPAVAIVVDGVYRTRIPGALDDLPAVERIEVLRGPQSTLFGKSASAGVVNIVTKKPSQETQIKASVSVGNYNSQKTKFYMTSGIADNLAMAVSGSKNSRDGFFQNQVPGAQGDVGNRDRYSVRADFLYTPSDDFSMRLIADRSSADEVCCGVVNAFRLDQGSYVVVAAAGGTIPNAATDPGAAHAGKTYFNFRPSNENVNEGISLNIEKDLGWGALTGMIANRTMKYSTLQDVDFDSAPLTDSGRDTMDIDSDQIELRLAFSTGNIDWTTGLFYSDEDISGSSQLTFGPAFRGYMNAQAYMLTGNPAIFDLLESPLAFQAFLGTNPETGEAYTQFYASGQGVVDSAEQSNESLSIFAQADIKLNDKLSLLLGVSRLDDDKEVSFSQEHNVPFSKIPGFYFAGPLAGADALQYLKPSLEFPNPGNNGKSSDSNTDYTAKLTYEYSDSVTVYGGVSTGFKASSWDLSRDSNPSTAEIAANGFSAMNNPLNLNFAIDGLRYTKPEESTVYEVGAKIQFANGFLNLTYFDQEVKNFQTSTFVGGGYAFSNAPLQTSDGFEFESMFALSESLTVSLGGIVHDPKYGDGHVVADVDLSNTRPSRVSKQRYTAALNYSFNAMGFDNMLSVTGLSESEYYTLENPNHRAVISANGMDVSSKDVVNVNLSMSKGAGTLTFWANNVFDEQWMETTFISPGSDAAGDMAAIYSGYPSAPRTAGVTVSFEF
ncbi:MAG: TonB-dependent receptor [Porticoccaceae bacterium]|nr:TonB-dependent receptor [Porticoccaceae bacterium]